MLSKHDPTHDRAESIHHHGRWPGTPLLTAELVPCRGREGERRPHSPGYSPGAPRRDKRGEINVARPVAEPPPVPGISPSTPGVKRDTEITGMTVRLNDMPITQANRHDRRDVQQMRRGIAGPDTKEGVVLKRHGDDICQRRLKLLGEFLERSYIPPTRWCARQKKKKSRTAAATPAEAKNVRTRLWIEAHTSTMRLVSGGEKIRDRGATVWPFFHSGCESLPSAYFSKPLLPATLMQVDLPADCRHFGVA